MNVVIRLDTVLGRNACPLLGKRNDNIRMAIWKEKIHDGRVLFIVYAYSETHRYVSEIIRNTTKESSVMYHCELQRVGLMNCIVSGSIVDEYTFMHSFPSAFAAVYIREYKVVVSTSPMDTNMAILEAVDLGLLNAFMNRYEKKFRIGFPKLSGNVSFPVIVIQHHYPYDEI